MVQAKKTSLTLGLVICGLASLFYIYDYFVQVAPSVMTHQLMVAFSINAESLGVLGSCFFITYTLMQIPAGMLLDHLGARRMLTSAAAVSGLGVLLFSAAHVLWIAEIARALIGLGSAFAFLSTVSLISRWFQHRYFAFLVGFLQFAGALGSIFGQAPLGLFVDHAGWRPAMVWIGVGSLILSLLFALVIRDHPPAVFSPALKTTDKMSGSKGSLRSIFKNKQVWWISVCGYVAWAPASALAALWGVPFMMKAYNLQNYQAGSLFTLFWVVVAVGGPWIGWLSDRIKRRRLPIAVAFLLGLVSSIALLWSGHFPLWVAAALLACLGVSVSVQSLTFGAIKDHVPDDHFATASGLNNMITVLSGAMLQPLIGLILTHEWSGTMFDGAPAYSLHDYQVALSVVPVVMLIGLGVIVFKVKETYCQKQVTELP